MAFLLHDDAYFTTEFVVNNLFVNWILFAIHSNIDSSVSGTAAVNQDDDVLIRTGPNLQNGTITSNIDYWILV